MIQLPIELQRYILEFIPDSYCKFCYKKISKINNKFCNKVCNRLSILRYNNRLWRQLIYIRNTLLILTITRSPVLLLPAINDNDDIIQSKYKWYSGISSFISLTLYLDHYYFDL